MIHLGVCHESPSDPQTDAVKPLLSQLPQVYIHLQGGPAVSDLVLSRIAMHNVVKLNES